MTNKKVTNKKLLKQKVDKKHDISSDSSSSDFCDSDEEVEKPIKKASNKKPVKDEKKSDKKKNKLRMINLCAGTGAFTYAFESTNKVDVVFANDIEESSKNIYDLNFKHKLTLGNICDIDVEDVPPHDILSAGFPCQPFSIAGKQKGFDDVRSNVFWKILEIVKYHKPQCIILENVKNLSSHDDGDTLKTIKASLQKEKYHIIHKVLNTSDITNIPQHRERIYIVCVREKKIFDKFNLDFPNVKKQKISKMLTNKEVDDKYYYDNEDNKIHKMIMDTVTENETIYQFRRIYVRENKNNECPTLTANMGTGGHNVPIILDDNGARKLIPRECFNFQGFPKEYILPNLSDCKLYKLAGNAVSIPVVKLIADRLVPYLFN
jgi:DNA (cytosine-5)-methyltransferase 1